MQVKAKVELHNEFDIIVKDVNTGRVRQTAKAYNILLNQIYGRLCARNTYFDSISFGGGTGTPDPARTSLFSLIATVTATDVEKIKDATNNIYYWKRKIVLAPAQYVGSTITEVGIYGGTVNSHAMIQDAEGNPISITKTDTDEITIYATVYFQLFDHSSGKIKFVSLPTANVLIQYLFGEIASTNGLIASPYAYGGYSRIPLTKTQGAIICSLGQKQFTMSYNTANKTWNAAFRFETTDMNGEITEVGMANMFRALLPISGIWDNFHISNLTIGTADGATTKFVTKLSHLKNVVVKIDGVEVPATDYTIQEGYPDGVGIRNDEVTGITNPSQPSAFIEGNGTSINVGTMTFDFDKPIKGIQALHNTQYTRQYVAYGSDDGTNWVQLAQTATNADAIRNLLFGGVKSYPHYKVTAGTGGYYQIRIIGAGDYITFNTAPASGTITVDGDIDYIPKSSDYVLDVSMTITFGEGVA